MQREQLELSCRPQNRVSATGDGGHTGQKHVIFKHSSSQKWKWGEAERKK